MLLVIDDQIIGKMTAPWKNDPIDWSETPGVEWLVSTDQHKPDLLFKRLAVVQPIKGYFMLLMRAISYKIGRFGANQPNEHKLH